MSPISAPGSAIITLGKDGEAKVWQPFFPLVSKGVKASIDKMFVAYAVQWRLSGLFSSAISNDPFVHHKAVSISNNINSKKTVFANTERASLDPTCMNVILTYQNGRVDMWPIPGLIDDTQGSLSTSAEPMWKNTNCHSDAVYSAIIWVHSDRSNIRDVDLSRGNADRFEIIGELAAYVKGNMNNTVGYTYKELKVLSQTSSMTTSSKDKSVILWQFSLSSTSVHSSGSVFLFPVPCRRFSCSDVPSNGVCVCTTYFDTNNGNNR